MSLNEFEVTIFGERLLFFNRLVLSLSCLGLFLALSEANANICLKSTKEFREQSSSQSGPHRTVLKPVLPAGKTRKEVRDGADVSQIVSEKISQLEIVLDHVFDGAQKKAISQAVTADPYVLGVRVEKVLDGISKTAEEGALSAVEKNQLGSVARDYFNFVRRKGRFRIEGETPTPTGDHTGKTTREGIDAVHEFLVELLHRLPEEIKKISEERSRRDTLAELEVTTFNITEGMIRLSQRDPQEVYLVAQTSRRIVENNYFGLFTKARLLRFTNSYLEKLGKNLLEDGVSHLFELVETVPDAAHRYKIEKAIAEILKFSKEANTENVPEPSLTYTGSRSTDPWPAQLQFLHLALAGLGSALRAEGVSPKILEYLSLDSLPIWMASLSRINYYRVLRNSRSKEEVVAPKIASWSIAVEISQGLFLRHNRALTLKKLIDRVIVFSFHAKNYESLTVDINNVVLQSNRLIEQLLKFYRVNKSQVLVNEKLIEELVTGGLLRYPSEMSRDSLFETVGVMNRMGRIIEEATAGTNILLSKDPETGLRKFDKGIGRDLVNASLKQLEDAARDTEWSENGRKHLIAETVLLLDAISKIFYENGPQIGAGPIKGKPAHVWYSSELLNYFALNAKPVVDSFSGKSANDVADVFRELRNDVTNTYFDAPVRATMESPIIILEHQGATLVRVTPENIRKLYVAQKEGNAYIYNPPGEAQ